MEKYIPHIQAIKGLEKIRNSDLSVIGSHGLAHDHIKIVNTGWILRIPRGNQLGMDDQDYLDLQSEIYKRMSSSGYAPNIKDIITPCHELPHGALVVEYIEGRAVKYQKDLIAIGHSLGKIHSIDVPHSTQPLERAAYPLAGQEFLLTEVFKDAFNNNALAKTSAKMLNQSLNDVTNRIAQLKTRQDIPLSLIGGDSHLGNYLIDKQGKAWLVDLEFSAYDIALIDLADAILPITSQLDPNNPVCPSQATRSKFYQAWNKAADDKISKPLKPLISLSEQTVQLRTLAWLSHWMAEGRAEALGKAPEKSIENWDAMAKHYLAPQNLRNLLKP